MITMVFDRFVNYVNNDDVEKNESNHLLREGIVADDAVKCCYEAVHQP